MSPTVDVVSGGDGGAEYCVMPPACAGRTQATSGTNPEPTPNADPGGAGLSGVGAASIRVRLRVLPVALHGRDM